MSRQRTNSIRQTATPSNSPSNGPIQNPANLGSTRNQERSAPKQFNMSDYLEVRSYNDSSTSLGCSWIATRQACPEGRFCPTNEPDVNFICPLGFFCPYDTAHPSYCCDGFYCETPASIKICPEGFFCPMGSTKPILCGWLYSICPIGSSRPIRLGVFGIFAALALSSFLVYYVRDKFHSYQRNRLPMIKSAYVDKSEMKSDVDAMSGSNSHDISIATQSDLAPSKNYSEFKPNNASSTYLPRASRWGLFGERGNSATNLAAHSEDETIIHFHVRFERLTKRLPNGTIILQDVTGEMRPSKLCAIMGPSGSGKSTLLHTLSGKTNRSEGRIFLNECEDEMQNYSKLVGFVPQEDIMIRNLTVEDILKHSAYTRLPSNLNWESKNARVRDLMAYLGIDHVAKSVIGDEIVRGISGGQRKRVNIGMELISSPSLLFLDEPTSGLDSSTSLELCQLLRRIATEKGLVVAAVIHSPSQQCIELFDDLILLGAGGRVVYSGSRKYSQSYFTNIGFSKPKNQSEPEFYLDVIAGKVPLHWNKAFRSVDLFDYWNAFVDGHPIDISAQGAFSQISTRARHRDAVASQQLHISNFAKAAHHSREYIEDVLNELRHTLATLGVPDPIRETPNPLKVLVLCARRSANQVWQTWESFFKEILLHMVAGTFMSLGVQKNEYLGKYPVELCNVTPFPLLIYCLNPYNTVTSSGLLICLAVLFAGISTSANTFGRERVVFWRDVASGMNTFPYFFAKILVDIPRILISGVVFSVALMFLWPYRGDWLPLMAAVVALYFSAFSMGYFVSTVAPPSATGVMATNLSLLWGLVLGGVMPKYSDVITYGTVMNAFRFLWELSAPRFFVEIVFLLETRGRPFEELRDPDIYNQLGYDHDGYWTAIFSIIAIGFLWQILALLGMKLTYRDRQK